MYSIRYPLFDFSAACQPGRGAATAVVGLG